MPEFDLDFENSGFDVLMEKLIFRSPNGKKSLVYYPGFIFRLHTIRDPFSKILRSFFPTLILGIFSCCIFNIDEQSKRLENLSYVLLTFITVAHNMRRNVPAISMLTFADLYLICYIIMSLLPMSYNEEGLFFNK